MNHSGLNWTFFPLINRTRLVNVKVKTDLYKVIFYIFVSFLYYFIILHILYTFNNFKCKITFFFYYLQHTQIVTGAENCSNPSILWGFFSAADCERLVMVQDKINVGKHREIPVLSMQDICNDLFFPKHKARASQECLKTTMLMSWSSQVKVQISVQLRIYEGT